MFQRLNNQLFHSCVDALTTDYEIRRKYPSPALQAYFRRECHFDNRSLLHKYSLASAAQLQRQNSMGAWSVVQMVADAEWWVQTKLLSLRHSFSIRDHTRTTDTQARRLGIALGIALRLVCTVSQTTVQVSRWVNGINFPHYSGAQIHFLGDAHSKHTSVTTPTDIYKYRY